MRCAKNAKTYSFALWVVLPRCTLRQPGVQDVNVPIFMRKHEKTQVEEPKADSPVPTTE